MAFLFICTRQRENLLDYGIFSREMAPVIFEDTMLGVAMWKDKCSGMPEFCLIQGVPSRIYLKEESKRRKYNGLERSHRKKRDNFDSSSDSFCRYCESKYSALCNRCYEDVKAYKMEDFVLIYEPTYVRVVISRRLHITFPSDVAFHVFREFTDSRTFRRRFCKYVRRKHSFRDMNNVICTCEGIQTLCELDFQLPYVIEILIELAESRVCLAWCYRLESLLRKHVILDETMAWLSTLGGAYSSLGDYFTAHSKMAGHISVTQLRISLEMGDPVMAAKCRLFFALSLMQRGALTRSKELIRKEFNFAKSLRVKDQTLINMCHGLWSKLKYYISVKKSRPCCYGNENHKTSEYTDHINITCR